MECAQIDQNDKAVYYINDKNKIEYVINKIKNSNKINFKDYIYDGTIEKNINEKILPIINKY